MKEWEEIKALSHKDRNVYEYEYRMRKTYDNLLPIVDNIYVAFVFYAWSKGYSDIATHGAKECWKSFCVENHNNVIGGWINRMEQSVCHLELKKYFNERIKSTSKFQGVKNDTRNAK